LGGLLYHNVIMDARLTGKTRRDAPASTANASTSAANATNAADRDAGYCATAYPLLLVHGLGVRDGKRHRIWGRIPNTLTALGAQVYFGEHDAWGTPENNARQLRHRVGAILSETGAGRVNIIAHSKGGLDARLLIAQLCDELAGVPACTQRTAEQSAQQERQKDRRAEQQSAQREDRQAIPPFLRELPVASLTTIATPHHGSRSLEALLSTIRPVFVPLAFVMNRFYGALGDAHPDFLGTCEYLRASHMQACNAAQPGLPILSQQFASCLHGPLDSIVSIMTYPFITWVEGPNDGLVALRSAAFDNYLGELSTASGRGVSHAGQVDAARRRFSSRTPPGTVRETRQEARNDSTGIPLQVEDILDFYIELVARLKAQGY
jgi:triacylglycerol lipase